MLKFNLKNSSSKKNVEVRHHQRIYFVSKAKLNYTLCKMGMCAKFDFVQESLRDFLFKNKLLYTEFLIYISDYYKCV